REFLAAQGLPLGNIFFDTYELSTIFLPELADRSLSTVAAALGIPYPKQHRALADAQVAKEVFLAFWERILDLGIEVLKQVVRLASHTDWPLGELFQGALQELQESAPLLQAPPAQPLIARLVAPQRRPPALEETEDEEPLDVEALAHLLEPGGLFARAFPHYEYRPQQVEMLRAVARTFNEGGQLIVEAGTGTGKSMAYLIPAVAYAVKRGRPVVISTNTINLQDQLYHKDIPDLQRVLLQADASEPQWRAMADFRAALLKGRNNYLCLRRWDILRRAPRLTPEQVSTLVKTLLWLPRTQTGDRAELALTGREYAAWNEIASLPGACQGTECPHFRQNRCFFFRARWRAESAHIIIANHSLLLSDVATENRVLPPYRVLVIDEAHHLESVATDQLGFHVTAEEFRSHLAAISNPLPGDREEGLLAIVPLFSHKKGIPEAARQALETLRREVRDTVTAARTAGNAFFASLHEFVELHREEIGGTDTYDRQLRITSGVRVQPDWSDIECAWEPVAEELTRIVDRLNRLYQICSELTGEEEGEEKDVLQEMVFLGQQTQEILEQVTQIVSAAKRNGIYWINVEAQTGTIGLHAAPLHVGELLQQGLYRHKDAIVLTSATLSTEGNTAFLRERLNLPDADEILLGSPFDYAQAALLLIPLDMPDPRDPQYARVLARALIETCRASEGRMLVLFTSHYALRQAYAAIRRALEREQIAVLAQGLDGSRHVLLEKFRRNPRSVLLGTSSFWEGIDVVGEALSVLVIAKLPFSVPTDPVFAARCELVEDSFYRYAVPQAVLRLKQGFGRLIRSKTDRGVVLLLDGRMLSRAYGTTFLRSLPPCTVRQAHLASIPGLVREWLQR
ncbi:MAG: helicase C-terminal domain-containing protein, partial [Chloroflexia bacterium]